MVAYSFAPQFIAPIVARTKLQTVRANRRRHARPGELIQLYTGMRTKHCRKIVDDDPVCIRLWEIRIAVDASARRRIAAMTLDGIVLCEPEMEAFAQRDGFVADAEYSALRRMGEFWLKAHAHLGSQFLFEGVCVRWEWPR
ncbi:hypothetical protein ACLBKU_16935 [Erythrobacter sp. NE805]|uniref:hypothetical protein n=1 Tax=Erythrobacter sp. NE805 TaxID=3389875 RepID=UPI00396B0E37